METLEPVRPSHGRLLCHLLVKTSVHTPNARLSNVPGLVSGDSGLEVRERLEAFGTDFLRTTFNVQKMDVEVARLFCMLVTSQPDDGIVRPGK